MTRKLSLFLTFVLSFLVAPIGSATASIYYDTASWLAAINALGPVILGPYTGKVTITDILTTAKSDHDCCVIIGKSSTTSTGTFDNFVWTFNLLGTQITGCFPDCTTTAPTERIVHFNPGIVGFYSLDARLWGESSFLGLLNGEEIIAPGGLYFGFFGWIGSVTNLYFSDIGSPYVVDSHRSIDDSNNNISLLNIQAAILAVDEPSALACLLAGLFSLVVHPLASAFGAAMKV